MAERKKVNFSLDDDVIFIQELMQNLSKPIPYQWRVQSFSKKGDKCTCVAYIDARQVMNVLDKYAIFGWSNAYKQVKDSVYSGIAIRLPSGDKMVRWDVGAEGNFEADKSAASDSFKRAAVKFGVGRFLYDLEIVTVDAKTTQFNGRDFSYPVDRDGDRIYDLTKYISENIIPMEDDLKAESTNSELEDAISKISEFKDKEKAVEWAKGLPDAIRVNKEFRKKFSEVWK